MEVTAEVAEAIQATNAARAKAEAARKRVSDLRTELREAEDASRRADALLEAARHRIVQMS